MSSLATMIPAFLLALLLQVVSVLAEGSAPSPLLSVCRPFGECEPCPPDALHEPFCQPFGNRLLIHCSPNRTSVESVSTPLDLHPVSTLSASSIQGETPAWQSCGRIVSRERADFYEFVACNLFFAAVAVSVALVRSRTVEARQARRIAARIGLARGPMADAR